MLVHFAITSGAATAPPVAPLKSYQYQVVTTCKGSVCCLAQFSRQKWSILVYTDYLVTS